MRISDNEPRLTRRTWLLIPMIAILVITVVLLTPDGPDNGVSVTFQHFINHPVNGRMAVFVITNQWNHKVMFSAGPPCEVKSHGDWKTLEPGGSSLWTKLADDSWEYDGTLEPGARATVAVIVPEGIRDWRAAVRSGGTPGKLDRLIFHLRANWKALRELKPLPGFKGNFYGNWAMTNYSREFTGEFNTLEPSSSAEIPAPPR